MEKFGVICGITAVYESAVPFCDTAYKAIYAKENYVKQNMREPTVQEIAQEIGIANEDIVYALDAIQAAYEPPGASVQ